MLFGATVFAIGAAILLAAPTGGGSLLVAGNLLVSSTTILAAGSSMMISGTIIMGNSLHQADLTYSKPSRKSNKEKSTDKPSWVSPKDVDPTKTAQENAKRILDNRYGAGNWKPGAASEYNKIVKWIQRYVIPYLIEAGRQRRGK